MLLRVPQSARAQTGWKRLHRWLMWCGFVPVIPMFILADRAGDLGQLELGAGKGAAVEALLWAVPRLALDPPPGTSQEAVDAAKWYLVAAVLAAALFVGSGLAWLQAQIPTSGELKATHRTG